MKKTLNSVITVLLLITVCAAMLFTPVSAAASAQISIRTVSSQGGTYSDKTDFSIGEKIYLPIKFSGIGDIGVQGFACDITFNSNALIFSDSSFTALNDENEYFYKSADGGNICIIWDTTSSNTVFNGDVIFLVFETKEVTENTDLSFTVAVSELYSSAKGKPDIPFTVSAATVNARIITETISDDVLSALRKLENITADSLDDIVAAETAWDTLSDAQKTFLKNNYSKEYDWLSSARTRFNAAVNQANIDTINKLVSEFKATYKDVLSLTAETVTPENEAKVKAAQTAYKSLPTSVTTRLDQKIPSLLQELLDTIESLNDAKAEAQSYEETYGYLTETTDVMLDAAFERYSGLIDEAVMVYDMLSDKAKDLVEDTYKKLYALKEKCDAIAADDEAKAAIRAEVNAFQQKWLKVFTINAGNVTVYDRTAIEMVLSDYKSLSEEAQKSLASRMTSMSGLLDAIKELEANSEETVYEPDNKITDSDTNYGDTQVITELKETVVEKKVTVTNTKYLNKKMTRAIWIMLILLIAAILTLIFPFVMTLRYKKRLAMLNEYEAQEEEI